MGTSRRLTLPLCAVLGLTLLCLPLGACRDDTEVPGGEMFRYAETIAGPLDTVTRLTAYCGSQAAFDGYAAQVRGELQRLEGIFSRYEEGSTVRRVNEAAGRGPVPAEPELIEAIESCKRLHSGAPGMNIALGSVTALWEQARQMGTPPSAEAVSAAASHTALDGVITTADTVELTDPQASLDLGGYAKGYAADCIAARLKEEGLSCFLLDCGESSIVCVGTPPGKTGWTVGLRNPDAVLNLSGAENPPELLGILTLSDRCVGVSGDYQKYFEKDGTYYSHILDETTGWPARYYRAVCVVADSAAAAEFYTKALFTAPLEASRGRAGGFKGLEALWVLPDGTAETTAGFALAPAGG